jgi:hypothetical protein
MAPDKKPVEQETVRTTIVGGRPPGSGQPLGPIPRGIEVLIKKAAVDPEFKALLLAQRGEAAKTIGLVLDPAEAMMMAAAPAAQLESVIAQTTVAPSLRPAFLGRAAAVMLVALGAGTIAGCNDSDVVQTRGIDHIRPPATQTIAPTPTAVSPPVSPSEPPPKPTPPSLGVRPDRPPTTPTDGPPPAKIDPAQAKLNETPPTLDEINAQIERDTATLHKMMQERTMLGIRGDRPPVTNGAQPDANGTDPITALNEKIRQEQQQARIETLVQARVSEIRKDWEQRFPGQVKDFEARLRRAATDSDYRMRAEEDMTFYAGRLRENPESAPRPTVAPASTPTAPSAAQPQTAAVSEADAAAIQARIVKEYQAAYVDLATRQREGGKAIRFALVLNAAGGVESLQFQNPTQAGSPAFRDQLTGQIMAWKFPGLRTTGPVTVTIETTASEVPISTFGLAVYPPSTYVVRPKSVTVVPGLVPPPDKSPTATPTAPASTPTTSDSAPAVNPRPYTGRTMISAGILRKSDDAPAPPPAPPKSE